MKNHTKYKNPRNESNYLLSTFYLIRNSRLYLANTVYKYILFNKNIIAALNFCMLLFYRQIFFKKENKDGDSCKNVCVIADDCSYQTSYSSEIEKCHFKINLILGRYNFCSVIYEFFLLAVR